MQTGLNVGADIASKTVVVACAAGTFAPRTLRNERATLGAWLQTLPAGSRLGLESTGSYHQLLADLAQAAGLTVYVLNARDLKKYAEGVGRRGKTDRLDAQLIARFIAHEHAQLHAYVPRSAAQCRLEQLLKRRGKLSGAAGEPATGLARGGGSASGTGGGRRGLSALAGARGRAGGADARGFAGDANPSATGAHHSWLWCLGQCRDGACADALAVCQCGRLYRPHRTRPTAAGLGQQTRSAPAFQTRTSGAAADAAYLRNVSHAQQGVATLLPSATRQGLEWYGRGGGPGA